MSREEAVEAYTAGRISRRTFVRHLIAAGVSAAAAVTYAEVLAPSRGSAGVGQMPDDLYPPVTTTPTTTTTTTTTTTSPPTTTTTSPPNTGAGAATPPAQPVQVQPRLTD